MQQEGQHCRCPDSGDRGEMNGHVITRKREWTANIALINGTATHHGEENRAFINNFLGLESRILPD